MRVMLKSGTIVIAAESDADEEHFAACCRAVEGHLFAVGGCSPEGIAFRDLGLHETACREPINILFDRADRWQPISNLAETPFMLRGIAYASVEGFWQGLKFSDAMDRRRVAGLSGKPAKRAAAGVPMPERFVYDGETYAVGGPGHHALMLEACRAKFSQHRPAREALLATGDRPLMHRLRRDSRTIPGAVMADIWMRVRASLRTDADSA